MTVKHYAAAVALALAVAAAAFSGTASAGTFNWADIVAAAAKHNGMVTMEDATAYSDREKQFAGFAPWIAENMKILDKNHDGMVSMDEMHVYMTEYHMTNEDLYKAWYR